MKIESPVLLRLGPVPFWRGTKKCLPELDLVYRRARTAAARLLSSDMPPVASAATSSDAVISRYPLTDKV